MGCTIAGDMKLQNIIDSVTWPALVEGLQVTM